MSAATDDARGGARGGTKAGAQTAAKTDPAATTGAIERLGPGGPTTVAGCLRRNASDPSTRDRTFLRFDDLRLSHAEYARECARLGNLLLELRPPDRPFHVAVLLDNVPEYLFALGAAALVGAVIVGVNNVQRGENLVRDIRHTDCGILLTEPAQLPLLEPVWSELGIEESRILVSHRREASREARREDGPRAAAPGAATPATAPSAATIATAPGSARGRDLDAALDEMLARRGKDVWELPASEPDPDSPYILVFTSGTTGAPKAVRISQARMLSTGERIATLLDIGPSDVGYLAMPLFHANSQQCGFMPGLLRGAALGMIRRFSRSRWLADVRRYGVTWFNYTGKPLSYILTTPRLPNDADNPLRVAYGNEGSARITREFAERFGCRIIDGFGATEGGFGFSRNPDDPPGSVGRPPDEIRILDAAGKECPRGILDAQGRIQNPDEAIGEIVNTAGVGKFEGYYNNPEATAERTRGGMYWSGDFGYKDDRGFLYFTGRDLSWIRVDGENFLAKPIEDALQRHPAIYLCAVYAVPDAEAGDRVMATVVPAEDAQLDPSEFYAFLAAQPDLSPKWIPTYVRISRNLPQTATNKILKRDLVREKFRPDRTSDPIWWRERGDTSFRPLDAGDWARLREAFAAAGRSEILDL